MDWSAVENGATIGTEGPEGGIIERDEEHPDGARITLERWTITTYVVGCHVTNWMVRIRFFETAQDAVQAFSEMKVGLVGILRLIPRMDDPDIDAKCDCVSDAIHAFAAQFP